MQVAAGGCVHVVGGWQLGSGNGNWQLGAGNGGV